MKSIRAMALAMGKETVSREMRVGWWHWVGAQGGAGSMAALMLAAPGMNLSCGA